MAIGGLALLTMALLVWRARTPPRWFRSDLVGDDSMESRSASFEQALAAQFTKVRGDDRVWSIRIPEEDMNEWLASRLPKWLEFEKHGAAKEVGRVQVCCMDGHIEIASECRWGIGCLDISPRIAKGPDGTRVDLSSTTAAIGHLQVPAFLVSALRPTDLFDSLHESEFRLADGRRVKVQDIEVLPGEIRLKLETAPAVH
jgi:hypothetical protein